VAFLLILTSFFGAWFVVHTEYTSEGTTHTRDLDFGLREAVVRTEDETLVFSYSDLLMHPEYGVFTSTQVFVFVSIIPTMLFLGFSILVGAKKAIGRIDVIFGVLAAACILLTSMFIMVELPNSFEKYDDYDPDISFFWGSDSLSYEESFGGTTEMVDVHMRWGAGWAWYITVISFILVLIGTSLLLGNSREQISTSRER
jgi:hypothetical protein